VIAYKRNYANDGTLSKDLITLLHQMFIGGIDDSIAGRFRKKGEYVGVGTYIAPAPEHVERMMKGILVECLSNMDIYFLDKVAKFHLDFETIHPFCDGNGRMDVCSSICSYYSLVSRASSFAIKRKTYIIEHSAITAKRKTQKPWRKSWLWP